MAIDEKRDQLRQMIEGTLPTKLTRRRDGSVEAVYDMLSALIADARLAGEFEGPNAQSKEPDVSMTFEIYPRNHPNPPRHWMSAESPPTQMAAFRGNQAL